MTWEKRKKKSAGKISLFEMGAEETSDFMERKGERMLQLVEMEGRGQRTGV